MRTLEKVSCLDGERVVQIAAGAEHSALLTGIENPFLNEKKKKGKKVENPELD